MPARAVTTSVAASWATSAFIRSVETARMGHAGAKAAPDIEPEPINCTCAPAADASARMPARASGEVGRSGSAAEVTIDPYAWNARKPAR